MQVRSGHSTCRSDESDPLSPGDRIAYRHERLAEMKIRGHDSTTVIDVHHIAGEKEIVDESNDSTVRCEHGLSERATEIDAEVATGYLAVEDAAGSEFTGDHRCARSKEGSRPHRR